VRRKRFVVLLFLLLGLVTFALLFVLTATIEHGR
jgi:hypothetical protein